MPTYIKIELRSDSATIEAMMQEILDFAKAQDYSIEKFRTASTVNFPIRRPILEPPKGEM